RQVEGQYTIAVIHVLVIFVDIGEQRVKGQAGIRAEIVIIRGAVDPADDAFGTRLDLEYFADRQRIIQLEGIFIVDAVDIVLQIGECSGIGIGIIVDAGAAAPL